MRAARHGDTDNNFAHREIFFAATREGDYSYCMRDVPVEVAVADLVTGRAPADSLTEEQLAAANGGARPSRRARIDVRSRFVAAPKDAVVECFATTASDCDLPTQKHEL